MFCEKSFGQDSLLKIFYKGVQQGQRAALFSVGEDKGQAGYGVLVLGEGVTPAYGIDFATEAISAKEERREDCQGI